MIYLKSIWFVSDNCIKSKILKSTKELLNVITVNKKDESNNSLFKSTGCLYTIVIILKFTEVFTELTKLWYY